MKKWKLFFENALKEFPGFHFQWSQPSTKNHA